MDDGVLVAGLALSGHAFDATGAASIATQGLGCTAADETIIDFSALAAKSACNTVPLRGDTAPWNTCAIWNVQKLARTGFLLVSEGIIPGVAAGIEEVACIALQQTLFPSDAVARVVASAGIDIEWDADRSCNFAAKLASKRSRAEGQLDALGLRGCGSVQHVAYAV